MTWLGVRIAFQAYVVPAVASRALRIVLLAIPAFFALVLLAFLDDQVFHWLDVDTLPRLRRFIIMPGVPIAAILLGEISLRDGITHRTLLYPLLGPVSRVTLAVVRTATTTAVVAALGLILVGVVGALARTEASTLGREALAIIFGSIAYTGLFGLVHLATRRGLIAGLVIFGVFDFAIGRIPFSLHNLVPSRHVRVISGHQDIYQLPISFGRPAASETVSALVLLAVGIVTVAATAYLFRRKNLGELC